MSAVGVAWLGRVEYGAAFRIQEALRARVLAGDDAEAILLLEHPPVITLGRAADPRHVLLDERALAARGVAVHRSSRGGDVTWHGPGQLVAYPVVRLARGVLAHVQAMADAVAATVRPFGVAAHFRRDLPGAWVTVDGAEAKLAAFGVHVRRRVAIHGLALNVTTAPDAFSAIVPCGIAGARVTSLQALTGQSPTVEALAPRLGAALADALGRAGRPLDPREIDALAEAGDCFPPSAP